MAASTTPPTVPEQQVFTASAHEVRLWIKQRIKAGEIKDCGHLDIQQWEWKNPETGKIDREFFAPVCHRHSFEWQFRVVSFEQKVRILEHVLHTNPIRCPANCTYYRNRWLWKAGRLWRRFWSSVALPFRWFAKAPWQTQVVIILGIIVIIVLWRFPQSLKPLTDLANAIRGK